MPRGVWTGLVALVIGALGFGAGLAIADDEGDVRPAAGDTAHVAEITRTALGEAAPTNAPGQTLHLQEVVIPAHEALPEHFHDGTQVAHVISGTLTYDINQGTALVTRAGGETEELTGPTETELHPGDSIIETAELVHHGSNNGDEPVVVMLAALLAEGAPAATAVGEAVEGEQLRVEADLTSQARTLHEAGADGTTVYGWNHLVGVGDDEVQVELLGAVNYGSGNGPFTGFVTFTYPDGSTLASYMQGDTVASDDGTNAVFTATMGVIDGTGTYEGAKGVGTFTGTRDASLGTAIGAEFDIRIASSGS